MTYLRSQKNGQSVPAMALGNTSDDSADAETPPFIRATRQAKRKSTSLEHLKINLALFVDSDSASVHSTHNLNSDKSRNSQTL